jgi:rRNA-processing protein CGR1
MTELSTVATAFKHTEATIESNLSMTNVSTETEADSSIVKGRNVSGRSWKIRPQKRASSLVKTSINNLCTTWEQKQASRHMRKEALNLQTELKEKKRQEAVQKKERRLENEKRRAENEFKAVQKSVQTLNHAKVGITLKSMSKKQLRQVKKTRMNQKTGVVEFVPAYAK